MREAVEECYERIGKYLDPYIDDDDMIECGSQGWLQYHLGVCGRTGVEGAVVDWIVSGTDKIVQPTHVKLLWMVMYQRYMKDGKEKTYRITKRNIAVLPNAVLSSYNFVAKIPGLQVLPYSDVVRQALASGADRFLLLSFGDNIDRVFGNGLRYSSGTNLEVNGELKIGGAEIVNRSVDFRLPFQMADFGLNWSDIRKYCDLRNRTAHSEREQATILEKIASLREKFGVHGRAMVPLSLQATPEDLQLGSWLSR